MFELPLLGSALQGLTKPAGPARADNDFALLDLLQGSDGAITAYSAELQALLAQMSPQVQQRLEEMVGGGMSLPEAAKMLLAETAADSLGEPFAAVLKERLPALVEATGAQPTLPRAPEVRPPEVPGAELTANPLAPLAKPLPREMIDPAELASLVPAAASFHTAAPNQLSAQLAGNLLDMGVPQQIGVKGWDAAIAERVMWMVQGDQQSAKLQLNPPQLGPLEVRVSVHQDQTSVSFIAQHAPVREALEAALPRLREMFDQQSLQLVRADVSDPGARRDDRAQDSSGRPAYRGEGPDTGPFDEISPATPARVIASSLVDLFA
jgi:flagellar hook-length control protein FliK